MPVGLLSPVLPEEPLPTQPDAVMVLVDELATFGDSLAAAALALAPIAWLIGSREVSSVGAHQPVQIIQDLYEFPVRKALNQGHTASKAKRPFICVEGRRVIHACMTRCITQIHRRRSLRKETPACAGYLRSPRVTVRLYR